LDSATGAEILDVLAGLWRDGRTIVVVTHDAQVASRAQRIIHMRDGSVVGDDARTTQDVPSSSVLQPASHGA
jgi:ABC-type lipoprotein export system ATPase subunit